MNKKMLSTVLAVSSILSTSYLFSVVDNFDNEVNKVYANAGSDVKVYDIILDTVMGRLANKGIYISIESQNKINEIIKKLVEKKFNTVLSFNFDRRSICISNEEITIDEVLNIVCKYKSWFSGNKLENSYKLNKMISDMYDYLIVNDQVNLDNLEQLNNLFNCITYDGSSYKIEGKDFSDYVKSISWLQDFVNSTCLTNYNVMQCRDKIILSNRNTNKLEVVQETQKLLKIAYNLRNQIAQTIKNDVNSYSSNFEYQFFDDGTASLIKCKKYAKNIVIPKNVYKDGKKFVITNIGKSVFKDCKTLETVIIPPSITEISGWAFYGCTNLKEINIPDGVKKINEYTFSNCKSLKTVIIPPSVTEISGWAFDDCNNLKTVTIYNNQVKIGTNAFRWCKNYCTFIVPKNAQYINSLREEGHSYIKIVYLD